MTFDNSAYAINGAPIGAALARRALYAEARFGGIVQKDDLKVSQLAVPGVGLLISEGVGLVLNDYQDDPNEVYVVSNPSTHTIPSAEMPAASPSARSFLLAVVVGDSDFSQAGHPWMPSSPIPEEQRATFQYVRPTLIQVSAGATALNVPYPALILARVDIPANTTTITDGMITDLRALASPRQSQEIFVSGDVYNGSSVYIPSATTFADWGAAQYSPTVKVPAWASRAILVAHINGVAVVDATVDIRGGMRAQLGSVSGPTSMFDLPANQVGSSRDNYMAGGNYNVAAIAGTNAPLRIEGYQHAPVSPTVNQRLRLMSGSQIIYDVRFFEQ